MFNKKKKFFQEKIESVQKQIWDLEFKVAKSATIREESRQLRDRAVEAKNNIEAQLKKEPNNKKLEEELALTERTIKSHEAKMQLIDDQVNGRQAQVDKEGNVVDEGQQGILELMASYAELRNLYKDYAKTL